MILGVVPLQQLDIFVSNLEEQEVADSSISVVTNPAAIALNFSRLTGSLHGIEASQLLTTLQRLGMPKPQANQLIHNLDANSSLVAVDLDPQDWLVQSFHDHAAQFIWSGHAS